MNSKDFVKDKATVIKTFKEMPDGSVKTLTGCRIFIPKRFVDKGIAEIGSENYTLGLFPLVTPDNKYMFFNAIAYVYLNPSEFKNCTIDGIEFIEFTFEPNTVVIKSMNLVQKDTLVYAVFNDFISNGNIPWYINYDDAGTILDTATTIAGTSIGENPETIEILISSISRLSSNKNEDFRKSLKTIADVEKNKPAYVPLKSVTYSVRNTTNKLAGAYFDEGITSALINPTIKPDTIGTILRK